jgi:cytochrome c biogenesis protein CcmG/thiol:disulfide interchange protein DsbE
MAWMQRLAGVLFRPGWAFDEVLKRGRGGVGDVVGLMFLAMLGTLPVESAVALIGASRGVGLALSKLVSQFIGFALLPLVVSLTFGLVLAGVARARGRQVPVDGLMTAATYLWVPVAVLGLAGAMLAEIGLPWSVLPHIPLAVFLKLDPAWWQVLARGVVAYGWSLVLVWVLWRRIEALATKGEQAATPVAPAAPGRWSQWALAGWLFLSWAGGGVYAATHYEQIRPLMPGDPAPGLELARADGQGRLALASLRGRPVVLEFWADWCSVCLRDMPEMDRWAAAHPQVTVLAIHQGGDPQSVREFLRAKGHSHPTFLVDEHHMASRAYKIDALPTYFVLDGQGKIVAARVGALPDHWLDHNLGLGHAHAH